MKLCIFVLRLPGEGNEDKMRLRNWRSGRGVMEISAPDAIKKYALIRLGDCAQILAVLDFREGRFQLMTRFGM